MKITLLTAPTRVGGLETSVALLAEGLAGAGHEVSLCQLMAPDSEPACAFEQLSHSGIRHVQTHHGARSYRAEVRAVRRLLADSDSALLHTHGQRADLVGRFAVRGGALLPQVSTVHGFVANGVRGRIGRRLHEQLLARLPRVIAVSEPLGRYLSGRMDATRVVTIPNAAPSSPRLLRSESRKQLGFAETDRLVGWVGRLSPEKGLDVFIHAVARLQDVTTIAVVIGEGSELEPARALASRLGLSERIRWMGAIPSAGRLFPAFDALALTSRTEGTPMTLLEAMSARVPIVATAVGGVPMLLPGECALLVPAEDPVAFARALDETFSHPDAAAHRAGLAELRANTTYGVRGWISAHLSVYQQLLLT